MNKAGERRVPRIEREELGHECRYLPHAIAIGPGWVMSQLTEKDRQAAAIGLTE